MFDRLEPDRSRPALMWQLTLWSNKTTPKSNATLSLFEEVIPPMPKTANYSEKTQLKHEVETLGFLISRHPLTLYKDRLKKVPYILARDMPQYAGKKVTMIGWLVTRKMTKTKHQETMEFISFEDTTAIYETVLFPKAYDKFCHKLTHARPYILQGKVEEEFSAVTLSVEEVRLL